MPRKMATRVDILSLIAARRARRPVRALPALDALFRRLAGSALPAEALLTEDRIWDVWMHHPHRGAEQALQLATHDIAARRYDIAETRLSVLLRRAPDFAGPRSRVRLGGCVQIVSRHLFAPPAA